MIARIDTTHKESECIKCRETIEKGEPKLIIEAYRTYGTVHLDCLGVTKKGGDKK